MLSSMNVFGMLAFFFMMILTSSMLIVFLLLLVQMFLSSQASINDSHFK